jgi:hypothetical protein
MKNNILGKIIAILVVVIIIGIGAYFKYSFPLSQSQLRADFKSIIATPIEHFYNASENSCGIWYSRSDAEQSITGKANDKVFNCFKKKFEACQTSNILSVIDQSLTEQKSVVYSLIRILRSNDQGECLIQHYYEKQRWDWQNNEIDPIFFINTCTGLSTDLTKSCKPDYIHEMN